MSAHTGFPASMLTAWARRGYVPARVGVYQTSRFSIRGLASSYAYWNGARWEPFANWGDYTRCEDMVWRGLNREVKKLPAGHVLESAPERLRRA